jgi:hypothetical protein
MLQTSVQVVLLPDLVVLWVPVVLVLIMDQVLVPRIIRDSCRPSLSWVIHTATRSHITGSAIVTTSSKIQISASSSLTTVTKITTGRETIRITIGIRHLSNHSSSRGIIGDNSITAATTTTRTTTHKHHSRGRIVDPDSIQDPGRITSMEAIIVTITITTITAITATTGQVMISL